MPSPFPGMDPFIEDPKVWPAFHHHLVTAVYQLMLPSLVDRYRARVGTRKYVSEMPLFTSIIRESHEEEYIEIRSRSDARLVTLVEIVSPANRTTPTGRTEYHLTRQQALAVHAGVVEIDLVTQGQPMLEFARDSLPEYDHAVTVTRGKTPDRYEIYTATVQKRLPKFKLPLAADDRDTILDLQICVSRAYDQAGIGQQVNYHRPLPTETNYSEESRNWIDSLLEDQNFR
jgi:hypothetical protein